MTLFAELFQHNHWANNQVLDGLQRAPHGFLDRQSRAEAGSVRDKLQHMVAVERGFLSVLEGSGERSNPPEDLPSFVAYEDETARRFAAFLAAPVDGAREVYVPWWERNFTVEECLSQVLSHSGQHRAEVAWELARAGIDTGEMDYIVWAAEVRDK